VTNSVFITLVKNSFKNRVIHIHTFRRLSLECLDSIKWHSVFMTWVFVSWNEWMIELLSMRVKNSFSWCSCTFTENSFALMPCEQVQSLQSSFFDCNQLYGRGGIWCWTRFDPFIKRIGNVWRVNVTRLDDTWENLGFEESKGECNLTWGFWWSLVIERSYWEIEKHWSSFSSTWGEKEDSNW